MAPATSAINVAARTARIATSAVLAGAIAARGLLRTIDPTSNGALFQTSEELSDVFESDPDFKRLQRALRGEVYREPGGPDPDLQEAWARGDAMLLVGIEYGRLIAKSGAADIVERQSARRRGRPVGAPRETARLNGHAAHSA